MRLKRCAMIVICAIGLTILSSYAFVLKANALHEPDLLTRRIKATTIKAESIDRVLDLLAFEYDVRLGIELGEEKLTANNKIDLDLPETNLKDFLDEVIAKDPRYTWKLEGGVIHVWPVKGRDTFVATLLNTKISHFAIIGESTRNRIFYDVLNLPEIGPQLAIADVSPMLFLNSRSMRKVRKETFFEETNLTLRELLDRIVLKTEIKQWVLSRWGKNSEYISLAS